MFTRNDVLGILLGDNGTPWGAISSHNFWPPLPTPAERQFNDAHVWTRVKASMFMGITTASVRLSSQITGWKPLPYLEEALSLLFSSSSPQVDHQLACYRCLRCIAQHRPDARCWGTSTCRKCYRRRGNNIYYYRNFLSSAFLKRYFQLDQQFPNIERNIDRNAQRQRQRLIALFQ